MAEQKKMVNLIIDRIPVSAPAGTLVVDAARKVNIRIPVFCYHPKLDPAGMCRMCLVEIGRPQVDRATGQPVLNEDGSVKVQFGPKLETACTVPVSEGMQVVCDSPAVTAARKEILEFLLTSHPLDCPVCDKGGECPLQNQTMKFGLGESRFLFDEKKHLQKHLPLGELIILDRERCVQCGRCVRFQHEVVDDPVLAFTQRGRALEIFTNSEPGFDSIFSGNTTDICPVGALTTADFRFGARPWELKHAASICTHCPVGCNLTYNVRREAMSEGGWVIKRAMPRQNEAVNEIWICDKGRFAYHYAVSPQRIDHPWVRKGSELLPATWDEALDAAEKGIRKAGDPMMVLAGGRLTNEDLFNLKKFADGTRARSVLYSHMAGGELVSQVGPGSGTDLGQLGAESLIMVVASDLHQEAPIWWLRVKQAAERGSQLVVISSRPTRLEDYATHIVRTAWGAEQQALQAFLPGSKAGQDVPAAAVEAFRKAENVLLILGSDSHGIQGSQSLAETCAILLVQSGHFGRAGNGLIIAWPNANTQGAFEAGFKPAPDLAAQLAESRSVYIAAADPAGDDPSLAEALRKPAFLLVQELFMTETARMADVVLPAQPYTEREGSYTSGERRVQRFYPVLPPRADVRVDYMITALLGSRFGLELASQGPAQVFQAMAQELPAYHNLTYQRLSEVSEQWPPLDRLWMHYGGTGYDNTAGLGVQLVPASQLGLQLSLPELPSLTELPVPGNAELLLLPVTMLYDRGQTVLPSAVLHERLAHASIILNPATAARAGLSEAPAVLLTLAGLEYQAAIVLDEKIPEGAALLPRSLGLPVHSPQVAAVKAAQPVGVGG